MQNILLTHLQGSPQMVLFLCIIYKCERVYCMCSIYATHRHTYGSCCPNNLENMENMVCFKVKPSLENTDFLSIFASLGEWYRWCQPWENWSIINHCVIVASIFASLLTRLVLLFSFSLLGCLVATSFLLC